MEVFLLLINPIFNQLKKPSMENKIENISWYVFIGSMFLGMGFGSLYGHTGTGTMIGMGVGFITSAIVEALKKK